MEETNQPAQNIEQEAPDLSKFPPEMLRAFFPDRRTVDGIALHSPTLAHFAMLNQLDCSGEIDEEKAIIAAYVLSHKSEDLSLDEVLNLDRFAVWMEAHRPDGKTLAPVAVDMIAKAVRAGVFDESKAKAAANIYPQGYGWPLEVAERICSEYGWSFGEAIHTPVGTLFALLACAAKRTGKEKGPDYYARLTLPYILKMAAAKKVEG